MAARLQSFGQLPSSTASGARHSLASTAGPRQEALPLIHGLTTTPTYDAQHPSAAPSPQPTGPATSQTPVHYSAQPPVPGSPDEGVQPRKRSKVSRACDECRRKKIKCDAPSEQPELPCSNCRRSSVTCQFSRVPQKRGPSKG